MRYFRQSGLSLAASCVVILLYSVADWLLGRLGAVNYTYGLMAGAAVLLLAANFALGYRFGCSMQSAGFWIQAVLLLLLAVPAVCSDGGVLFYIGAFTSPIGAFLQSVRGAHSMVGSAPWLVSLLFVLASALLPTGLMFLGMCTARRKKCRSKDAAASRSESV